ncbi:restriction endonuclease subunit S [Marinobacter gelidimuriae]|uniref:restriction endonuclease subunit S n=1 Tax=Marinobacter gelidimuriae TaxID=2739064 RepID=UPI00035E1389|nr:restriction endonuclease subunit S [Marinobacter gelidimuriae]
MSEKQALVPRLRFPEFRDAGEWEDKPLAACCYLQAGKFVRASDIHDEVSGNRYPCYGGNGLRGYTDTFTHSGIYSLVGRQGALCGNVNLASNTFHATEHAVVANVYEGVNTIWFFYKLIGMNLNQYATGQAQPGLSVENLNKLPVKIPKQEKEQQKIADCLSSLDELIAAQTEKLNALKTHKKGLMQQLFPSPEAVGA